MEVFLQNGVAELKINIQMKKSMAIVTGGSSGIGLAISEHLQNENFYVINADIQPPKQKNSETYIFLKCDITKAKDVAKLSQLVQSNGEPTVLILNAGRGIHEKIREGDPEKWIQVIDLNICGTLRVLRAVLPFMHKGHVIFMSSVSALNPYPYGAVYAGTKSALNTIAETLRLEELPDIKVTTVSPGVVKTPFFENMISGSNNVESTGWGAIHPNEIAETIIFILKQKKDIAINNITIRPSGQIL